MTGKNSEKLTKMAVVDCVIESGQISDYIDVYLKTHGGEIPEGGISLNDIMKSIEGGCGSNSYKDDSFYQILIDYKKSNPEEFSQIRIMDFLNTGDRGKQALIQTGYSDGLPTYQLSFSGTMSAEGITDAEGLAQESTVQQAAAFDYMTSVVDKYNIAPKHLDISGHSNGGNKTVYCTMNAYGKYDDAINTSLSLDGQGFSKVAAEEWEDPLYSKKKEKLYAVYGEYDYVHSAGINVVNKDHQYYLKYNSGDNELAAGDSKFESFHKLCYLFQRDKEGRFSSQLEVNGEPSQMVLKEQEFMEHFMETDPEYTQEAAKWLMTFIWSAPSPDGETAGTLNLSMIKQLIQAVGTPDSAMDLAGFLFELGELLDIGLLENDWSRFKITELALVLSIHNCWSSSTNKERERKKKNAAKEATNNPNFRINPRIMMSAASQMNYFGGQFRMVSRDVNSVSSSLPNYAYGQFPVHQNMSTYADLDLESARDAKQTLENYNAEVKKILTMRTALSNASGQLSQCVSIVNGILGYLRDTGNDFLIIENRIKQQGDNWE